VVGEKKKTWVAWDGRRWTLEGGDSIALERAHATVDAIREELKELEAETDRASRKEADALEHEIAAHRKWCVVSGNSPRWRGMLEGATAALRARMTDFDMHPFMLNVANGSLDLSESLKTVGKFTLLPPNRARLITSLTNVEYKPDADCPNFRRFLDRIVPAREVQVCLQSWFGYCLTGDMREQKIVIALGSGANGKSTLFDLMMRIMGDYSAAIDIKSLLHNEFRRGADASPDIARLFARRMVLASEPESTDRLAESLLKAITGGDRLVARPLYRDPFEFQATFKISMLANTLPIIRGTDNGIWRRILVVRFDQVIPEAERRPKEELIDELMAEASGILNWLLDGWLLYREAGLQLPPQVVAETQRYKSESNPVGLFLEAATERTGDGQVSASALYEAYTKWCGANAIAPRSNKYFGDRMTDLGFERKQYGIMFYLGLRLVRDTFDAAEQDIADR
jgi:putative DNA primase/helicase